MRSEEAIANSFIGQPQVKGLKAGGIVGPDGAEDDTRRRCELAVSGSRAGCPRARRLR
jgi:hypothetical protein